VETAEQLQAYVAQAAGFKQADAAWRLPDDLDPQAGGAPGYTRYVFRETSDGVVLTQVEGPIGDQVRCQDTELPCSYLELKALHESGDPIPEELAITPGELGALVAELDELNAYMERHRDINTTCAEGFISDRTQTPNMGTHLYNLAFMNEGFNPSQPQILLYTLADDTLPSGRVGQCVNGAWDGDPMQLVGTAFILPPYVVGTDHPEGFSGDLDNWHSHFNLCRGRNTGRDLFVTKAECEAVGGNFNESIGWMLHAWVDPEHDNQLGVFSMWNSTIAPFLDDSTMRSATMVQGSDFPEDARQTLITNFAFEQGIEVDAGQSVYFNNSDSVPHTISAGTPDAPDLDAFDSGLLAPGDNWEFTTSEPGTYTYFCALHPDMTATIVVS
jgi:plastocyanin